MITDTAIDKKKFIEWYFSGSAAEQYDLEADLGREVRENLEERGTFTINVDDLIASCGDVYLDDTAQSM